MTWSNTSNQSPKSGIHNHVSDFNSHQTQKRGPHTKNSNISVSVAQDLSSSKILFYYNTVFLLFENVAALISRKKRLNTSKYFSKNQKQKNKIKWQTKSALMLQKLTWPQSKRNTKPITTRSIMVFDKLFTLNPIFQHCLGRPCQHRHCCQARRRQGQWRLQMPKWIRTWRTILNKPTPAYDSFLPRLTVGYSFGWTDSWLNVDAYPALKRLSIWISVDLGNLQWNWKLISFNFYARTCENHFARINNVKLTVYADFMPRMECSILFLNSQVQVFVVLNRDFVSA